jgi:hypothetical protein
MAHLVESIKEEPIPSARTKLAAAHDFIVSWAQKALRQPPTAANAWGISTKRLKVEFPQSERPELVKKGSERLAEILNITATVERLLDALQWFEQEPRFQGLEVLVCHPSTSSAKGTNDLVLAPPNGLVCVRCEVCDVAARTAGQNGKEKKDLKSLHCESGVPKDGVHRFLCTSSEFADALTSEKRDWTMLPYRYLNHRVADGSSTVMLEILAPDDPRRTNRCT